MTAGGGIPTFGGGDWGGGSDGGRGQHCPACPQLVIANPSGLKKVGMTPPAVRIKTLVAAEGGDWGGGNPVALASSTYRHFTSPRHCPACSGQSSGSYK